MSNLKYQRTVNNELDHHLVCVREATFSFQSVFFMHSKEFAEMVAERRKTLESLALITNELTNELFELINKEESEKVRRNLISLKRDVFNQRLSKQAELFEISDRVALKLRSYRELLNKKISVIDTYRYKVYREIETECKKLLENQIFLSAIKYSCPELSLSHISLDTKFSKWLRSVSTIYAYALKHITKTAPLFTFSRVYLPKSKGEIKENFFEIVLNSEVYSELENLLKSSEQTKSHLKYELVTNWRSGDRRYFLIFQDNTVRIISYKSNQLLEKIINFFKESSIKNSPVCAEQINNLFPHGEETQSRELIDKLQKAGVLLTYLIDDVQAPTESLIKCDPARTVGYSILQEADGKMFESAQIYFENQKVADEVAKFGLKTSPTHIGYFYAGNISQDQNRLANHFAPDLKKIADIFRVGNNNDFNRMAINETVNKCFDASGKQRMPFLELITRIILVKTERESKEQADYKKFFFEFLAFQEKALTLSGDLTDQSMEELTQLLPQKEKQTVGNNRNFKICFVGAVDTQTPHFYVHNVFSGNKRFTGKYLTKQKYDLFEPDNVDSINVEVFPAWNIPQHRVNRSLPVGFSFDARSRSFFDQSINPEDIDVMLDNTPVFIHRPTGKNIKFYYRGLALLQRIPIPYKILLFDQVDFFVNVFAQSPPQCRTDQKLFLDSLSYRSIVLRRAGFCVGIDLLKEILVEKDWLYGACLIKEFMGKNLGFKSDHLYFRPIANNIFTDSPRFLNILHPLSWDIFRRTILKLTETTSVHFTECQPLPQQMFEKEDGNHFTEFMIEV